MALGPGGAGLCDNKAINLDFWAAFFVYFAFGGLAGLDLSQIRIFIFRFRLATLIIAETKFMFIESTYSQRFPLLFEGGVVVMIDNHLFTMFDFTAGVVGSTDSF
jgi:hypothetical protein